MLKDKFVKVEAKHITFKRKMPHTAVCWAVIKGFETRYPFAKECFFYSIGKTNEVTFFFSYHSDLMAN